MSINRLLFCIILSIAELGCTTLPVLEAFPEVPTELTKSCEKLETIDATTVPLSELMKVVSRNYTRYFECANLLDGWNDWYTKQKANFDQLNPKD